jgi:hypothetical protein
MGVGVKPDVVEVYGKAFMYQGDLPVYVMRGNPRWLQVPGIYVHLAGLHWDGYIQGPAQVNLVFRFLILDSCSH